MKHNIQRSSKITTPNIIISKSKSTLQPKLAINQPGDRYEQEADRVANAVMGMSEGDTPILQRMSLSPVSSIQRASSAEGGVQTAPPVVSEVLSSGGGQPLDVHTQQFMESRFGRDFSQVRIHTDHQAAASAAAIQARAYTSGRDVVFGQGEYRPGSVEGKRLLAHELGHVGQQGGGVKPTKSNIVQLSEYTGQDHAGSVPHLMRILDEGDVNSIRAALEGLQRAERSRSETNETTRVVFTIPQGDTYNLSITSNEIDEFIRMYERYLSRQEQTGHAVNISYRFVKDFNYHFKNILHIFNSSPDSMSSSESATGETSGTGGQRTSVRITSDGQNLSTAEIAGLFTQSQITLLTQYFSTNIIPERLFNGDETNLLNAGQRLVVSAHILANGRYNPGLYTQHVHARMCGHWVEIVHHYAGTTPPGGNTAFHEGSMGTTDPTGQIVLGGGSQTYSSSKRATNAPDRTEARRQRSQVAHESRVNQEGIVDTINAEVQTALQARDSAQNTVAQSEHASPEDRQRVREAERGYRAADRRLQSARGTLATARTEDRRLGRLANQGFSRRPAIPLDDILGLQRGDWLYIHNDNDSITGDHSVIFSRWLSWVQVDPTRGYGQAELFSQGSPDAGGRAHTDWIGNFNGMIGNISIHAITSLRRFSPDSNPADSTDEILQPLASRTLTRSAAANRRFIERHHLNESDLMQRLATQNQNLLDALAWRLTHNQRTLLRAINQENNLERRVQLNERLRNLDNNVAASEAGRARSVERVQSGFESGLYRRREATRELLQRVTSRFNTVHEKLQAFAAAIEDRPDGVVLKARAIRPELPNAFNVETFTREIGLTVAADALVALNTLLQRETVTLEQAEDEFIKIDELVHLFSNLSSNIPGARSSLRNWYRSTQRRNNEIREPATSSDLQKWSQTCSSSYRSFNPALTQLNSHIANFARNLRRQGGTLPYVTTHSGGNGETFSPTGLLSNVPDIASTSR